MKKYKEFTKEQQRTINGNGPAGSGSDGTPPDTHCYYLVPGQTWSLVCEDVV